MKEKMSVYDYLIRHPKGWLCDIEQKYKDDLPELYDLGFLARGVSYYEDKETSSVSVRDRYRLTQLGLKQCRLSSTLEEVEMSMNKIISLMNN